MLLMLIYFFNTLVLCKLIIIAILKAIRLKKIIQNPFGGLYQSHAQPHFASSFSITSVGFYFQEYQLFCLIGAQ